MMERCDGCFTDENIIGRRRLGGIRVGACGSAAALRFTSSFFDITIGRGLLGDRFGSILVLRFSLLGSELWKVGSLWHLTGYSE